jgi:flagellar basal body rod protein FlgG
MIYGLWMSAGGLQVNEYRQSLAANNLANVDTVGFKEDLAVIHERRVESAVDPMQRVYSNALLDLQTGGTWVRPTHVSFAQGTLEHTGNPHDAAISGRGFFTVSDGDDTRYTRDGRFTVTPATQELVLVAGNGKHKVLGEDGRPMVIPKRTGRFSIARDGTVRLGETVVGRLGVVDFEDPPLLRKVGENLFEYVGSGRPAPAEADVLGNYIERSTVNPARTLVNVIEVARAYELNARLLAMQDETLGLAAQRVGRVA